MTTKARLTKRGAIRELRRGFLLLCVSFVVWRLQLSADVHSTLKDLSRRGEAINVAQLSAAYLHVPDDQNAAPMWLAGFDQMLPTNNVDRQEVLWKLRFSANQPGLAAELLQEATRLVETNHTALDIFRCAAAMSKCRYPLGVGQTPWLELSHLPKLTSIAHLLRLEAYVAAEKGDSDGATTATLTLLALGESLSKEPAYESIFMRARVDSMARRALAHLLNNGLPKEIRLSELAEAFAQTEGEDMLARKLAAQRAEMTTILQQPYWYVSHYRESSHRGTKLERIETVATVLMLRATGWLERDLQYGLNAFETLICNAAKADPARFESQKEFDMLYEQARKGYYMEPAILLARSSRSIAFDAERRAASRVARTSIALERYRIANGTIPDQLGSLSPRFLPRELLDPFDGKPLRYKKDGNAYVVYSVGPDMADNGGAVRPSDARYDTPFDITFIVERSMR